MRMDPEGNFQIIQENCDVAALESFSKGLTIEQWDEWSMRQEVFETHRETKTFPLVWSSLDFIELPTTLMNADSLGIKLVQPFIVFLEKIYSGIVYKAMLILLPSGGKIPPHIDGGEALLTPHRCHLVITSAPGVDFMVGGVNNYYPPGTLFEFNNSRQHGVINNSGTDRVHLVIDILPKDA